VQALDTLSKAPPALGAIFDPALAPAPVFGAVTEAPSRSRRSRAPGEWLQWLTLGRGAQIAHKGNSYVLDQLMGSQGVHQASARTCAPAARALSHGRAVAHAVLRRACVGAARRLQPMMAETVAALKALPWSRERALFAASKARRPPPAAPPPSETGCRPREPHERRAALRPSTHPPAWLNSHTGAGRALARVLVDAQGPGARLARWLPHARRCPRSAGHLVRPPPRPAPLHAARWRGVG